MVESGYKFSNTECIEMDEMGKEKGAYISGSKHVPRRGMHNFCWTECLTVAWIMVFGLYKKFGYVKKY